MKWYKHISTSLDDPFIYDLMSHFKANGYLVFFGTLEIMAREFSIKSPGKVELSLNYLSRKLRLSVKVCLKILNFCSENDRIHYELNGEKIVLFCPKLRDLCDEYTRSLLKSGSGETPEPLRKKSSQKQKQKQKQNKEPIAKADPPGSAHYSDQVPKHAKRLSDLCKSIVKLQKGSRPFNAHQCAQKAIQDGVHPLALIKGLESLEKALRNSIPIKNQWAYLKKIFSVESGNFTEREHVAQAQEFKKQAAADPGINALLSGIGKEG